MSHVSALLAIAVAAVALSPMSWAETPVEGQPTETCQSCNARHAAIKKLRELREEQEPILLPETTERSATESSDE